MLDHILELSQAARAMEQPLEVLIETSGSDGDHDEQKLHNFLEAWESMSIPRLTSRVLNLIFCFNFPSFWATSANKLDRK